MSVQTQNNQENLTAIFARQNPISAQEHNASHSVEATEKKAQEALMDQVNLTGEGEFAARGSGHIARAKFEVEKKKKEQQQLTRILSDAEQYRQKAIDGLLGDIDRLEKEREAKKKEFQGLKSKENNLLHLQQKRENGTFDQNDPDDAARMKQAGLNDASQIDEALKAIQEQKGSAQAEIEILGQKIEARKKASIELRENKGALPEEVNKILEQHGLKMDSTGKSVQEIRQELNTKNREDKNLKGDKQELLELDEQEVSQFMQYQASYEQGTLTKEEIHLKISELSKSAREFLSMSSPESKALFEEVLNQKTTHDIDLSNNNKNDLDSGFTLPQISS